MSGGWIDYQPWSGVWLGDRCHLTHHESVDRPRRYAARVTGLQPTYAMNLSMVNRIGSPGRAAVLAYGITLLKELLEKADDHRAMRGCAVPRGRQNS